MLKILLKEFLKENYWINKLIKKRKLTSAFENKVTPNKFKKVKTNKVKKVKPNKVKKVKTNKVKKVKPNQPNWIFVKKWV